MSELAALRKKVTGDLQAISDLANGLRTVGDHVTASTDRLNSGVTEVGKAWQGESATAFVTYMRAYPGASGKLRGALFSCATALDTAAGELRTAQGTVEGLYEMATFARREFLKANPDATQAQADEHVRVKLGGDPVGRATTAANKADKALSTAATALDEQLGEDGFGFFQNIRQPGGADFTPGDKKPDWSKVAGFRPTLDDAPATQPGGQTPASPGGQTPGAGGETPGGASPTGSGAPGNGAGPPSSYGDVPAPKQQVVDWIKEALSVIKSPEMAAVLAERGLDVSDLDPNDPKDIERIWAIIHHESSGNPNAINTWDQNARDGVPSQGLMQTIPPTFDKHHLPGYDKIREPVDNIIAGVLYTYSRYGSLAEHPGIASLESGGGYKPY
ncbi:transglycosylase SLT domain-containing protein [Nonomuraea sp. MCN248]|uniref:Transglycosylase SLT domain-containing protein n=1 Tax=Nonomuraea corallina TaxID=2989783 RepID=A0ABT4SIW2_9ACTN|nr:transglycosylase SLT domain-containing protein [Nonomuraea corallina]MDA0637156.1 transglycosylase SLT domain-containing protein [Nonomuraea corallina]